MLERHWRVRRRDHRPCGAAVRVERLHRERELLAGRRGALREVEQDPLAVGDEGTQPRGDPGGVLVGDTLMPFVAR